MLMTDLIREMSHSPRLETLKAADLGLFDATWCPHAGYERLRIIAFLAAWVRILFRHT